MGRLTIGRPAARVGAVLFLLGHLILMSAAYLPLRHDPAALAAAAMAQAMAAPSLLLAAPSLVWLVRILRRSGEDRIRRAARGFLVWLLLSQGLFLILFGAMESPILGVSGLAFLILTIWAGNRSLAPDKPLGTWGRAWAPAAAIVFAPLSLAAQAVLSGPLNAYAAARGIQGARPLIRQIEEFRSRYGFLPDSMNGLHHDYETGLMGVERFHYTRDGDSYSVYFVPPRFFFHPIGDKEAVVYSPEGQHLMMSHMAWHLLFDPQEKKGRQGWYSSRPAGRPDWVILSFD